MKHINKKSLCMMMVLALILGCMVQVPVQAKTGADCKTLCVASLKATGGSSKLKYTSTSAMDFGALSASARKKVKTIQYLCDTKEVYSLCVIQTKTAAQAKSLLKVLKNYKKSNCKSDYLTDYSKTERKVSQNAVYGRKGTCVWYIAMSPKKKVNQKGQAAIRKKL